MAFRKKSVNPFKVMPFFSTGPRLITCHDLRGSGTGDKAVWATGVGYVDKVFWTKTKGLRHSKVPKRSLMTDHQVIPTAVYQSWDSNK